MAFVDGEGSGELSDEIKEENSKYGVLMSLQGDNPIQGIYRGFKECPGFEGKGKQKSHSFEQPDGSNLKVRGFGLMDHIIAKDYAEGDLLRVTYTGKDGKFHKCRIAKDDGTAPDADSEDM
jgi:hypothetical protein